MLFRDSPWPAPLAALLLAVAPFALLPAAGPHDAIRATPVPLDPHDPGRRRIGRLRYLGGWQLTSADLRFGGLSALGAWDGRLVAVADTGMRFAFRIDGRGRIDRVEAAALPAPAGGSLRKRDRDSEALASDPATGRAWVAFEVTNRIRRYAPGFARVEAQAEPPAMAMWTPNNGPEAMVRLHDGRFLVISEAAQRGSPDNPGLLFAGDPTDPRTPPPVAFGYRPPPRFLVTEAAELPDGRLLLLQRRLTLTDGIGAVVSLLDPRAIRPGARLRGEEVARLAPPLNVDNMEGMTVTQEGGRTIVWLLSDDNFLPVERTLLFKFAFEG